MAAELGRLRCWGRGARAPALPWMAVKEPGARAGSAHRDTPGRPTRAPGRPQLETRALPRSAASMPSCAVLRALSCCRTTGASPAREIAI